MDMAKKPKRKLPKRRSPVSKDLGSKKYRQRVKPGRRYVPSHVTPTNMVDILLGGYYGDR